MAEGDHGDLASRPAGGRRSPRQIKLGMFYWPTGHHIAAWRHPDAVPDCGVNPAHIVRLGQLAEQGLYDMFFMADAVSFWRGDLNAMERDAYGTWIEPYTVMCLLSQHTRNIGLVCTSTSTFDQPYNLARRFASLDLISGGRGGWNLVTSANRSEADSFGLPEHLPKAERYRRGREFAHLVRGLWNSWQDGAFVMDRATSIYHDRKRMNVLLHEGRYFKAKGPLNVAPSPQGEPVMVQAGASEDGRELAAETAEVVFGAHMTLASAQEYYGDVKERMRARFGRDPDSLKIMPGLFAVIAPSEAEARARYDALQDLIDPVVGLQLLSKRLDFDLSGYDLDGPVPELPHNDVVSTRRHLMLDVGRREGLSIRALYKRVAGARGHYTFVGTPKALADMMQEWVETGGCDGFNMMPPVFPHSLVEYNEMLIPELQRRGAYRTAYEATTLRGNLGLTRPIWKPTAEQRLAVL
jgi:FMN-dependent oxidoreductase (nitrilotriacetate monooxygenase family)